MKFMKAVIFIAVIIALLTTGLIVFAMRGPRDQESRSTSSVAGVSVPAGSSSRDMIERPATALSNPVSVKRSAMSRNMLDWQRDLYDPQTTADTFAAAVDAAEAGDLTALREVHDLLASCKAILQYVREGGERERWLSGQLIPPNGIRWFEPFFDRCAAIATATTFARWPLTEGRLTAAYWEQLGARFDDPLFRSFAIGEDIESYARSDIGRRAELRARAVDNLHRVLRAGDTTAWWDLGLRLLDPRLTADKSVGLALIQVACARGYDCTKNNVHNWFLRCDGNFDPNCGSAATNIEAFRQRESAATNARAQSLYERLTLLLDREDWDEIEELVPLDGTAFK